MILTSRRAGVAAATFGLVIGGGGVALATGQAPDRATTVQARATHHAGKDAPKNIPNLGRVKTQIKAYYGDDGDGQASRSSRYATQVRAVERKARRALPKLLANAARTPVVLVDVDDTTLLTYNYEATHDFGYDPVANATYIHEHGMTQVFGMPKLLRKAARKGADVYFLTGRPETQRADTLRDLAKAGYPDVTTTHLFMRNRTAPPSYLPCEPTCTTIQYKSLTRRHINSLGKTIVLNLGDQRSDLKGGYATKRLKVPNPMYYLP